MGRRPPPPRRRRSRPRRFQLGRLAGHRRARAPSWATATTIPAIGASAWTSAPAPLATWAVTYTIPSSAPSSLRPRSPSGPRVPPPTPGTGPSTPSFTTSFPPPPTPPARPSASPGTTATSARPRTSRPCSKATSCPARVPFSSAPRAPCSSPITITPSFTRTRTSPAFSARTSQEQDHWRQFVEACLGRGRASAGFDYAGPLTEAVLLGSVACRFPQTTLQWNARELKFDNLSEASQHLRRPYRPGWTVKGLSE